MLEKLLTVLSEFEKAIVFNLLAQIVGEHRLIDDGRPHGFFDIGSGAKGLQRLMLMSQHRFGFVAS